MFWKPRSARLPEHDLVLSKREALYYDTPILASLYSHPAQNRQTKYNDRFIARKLSIKS